MFRTALIAASMFAIGSTPAFAAPCRGAGGKFVKCPTTAPAKATRCKDAKGRFAKCGLPGTHAA